MALNMAKATHATRGLMCIMSTSATFARGLFEHDCSNLLPTLFAGQSLSQHVTTSQILLWQPLPAF